MLSGCASEAGGRTLDGLEIRVLAGGWTLAFMSTAYTEGRGDVGLRFGWWTRSPRGGVEPDDVLSRPFPG